MRLQLLTLDRSTFIKYISPEIGQSLSFDEVETVFDQAIAAVGIKIEEIEENSSQMFWTKNRFLFFAIKVLRFKTVGHYNHSGLTLNQVFENYGKLLAEIELEWKIFYKELSLYKNKKRGFFSVVPANFKYGSLGGKK